MPSVVPTATQVPHRTRPRTGRLNARRCRQLQRQALPNCDTLSRKAVQSAVTKSGQRETVTTYSRWSQGLANAVAAGNTCSFVLVNNNKLRFQDFLQFAAVLVVKRSDTWIHRIQRKAVESLRPIVCELAKCTRHVTTWCASAIELEAILIVVIPAFLLPSERYFLPTHWTMGLREVCSAIEESD